MVDKDISRIFTTREDGATRGRLDAYEVMMRLKKKRQGILTCFLWRAIIILREFSILPSMSTGEP